MQTTRRTILKLVGGATAGFVLSPIPWKLLDDVSIWTQNGSFIPKLARGPETYALSTCTLCTAACPVRARMIGGNVVSLSPVSANTPLCAYGLAGHHLAFAPSRITIPAQRRKANGAFEPVPRDEAYREVADLIRTARDGSVVWLTARPYSALSTKIAANFDAAVHTPPQYDGSFFDAQRTVLDADDRAYGLDPTRLRAILSVGATLTDGWGISSALLPQFRERRGDLHLVHAGPHQSHTAAFADQWIPLSPGDEAAFVLAVCSSLVQSGHVEGAVRTQELSRILIDYRPETISGRLGIDRAIIDETARRLRSSRPSIVLCDDAMPPGVQSAVWTLNALLGSFGRHGCLVPRRLSVPAGHPVRPRSIVSRESHSVRILFVDQSVSSAMLSHAEVERILSNDASLVVRFSPYFDQLSTDADMLFSTPAPFESIQESPCRTSAVAATFGVSAPLWNKPDHAVDAVSTIGSIFAMSGHPAENMGSETDALRERAEQVFRSGRGTLCDPRTGERTTVRAFGDSSAVWDSLLNGLHWEDDATAPARTLGVRVSATRFSGAQEPQPTISIAAAPSLAACAVDAGVQTTFCMVSPLLSKIHQENSRGRGVGTVLIHPTTAAEIGVRSRDKALVTVGRQEREVIVRTSAEVVQGAVMFSEGIEGLPDFTPETRSAT